jgi:Protein of unknown function (DUF3788)
LYGAESHPALAGDPVLPNAFVGRKKKPTEADLAVALGATKPLWDDLLARLATANGAEIREWKSYAPKTGWVLRVLRKRRTIVWLGPCPGCFRVTFILGDRALEAARTARLSKRTLKVIAEAPRYPEGTGVRLLVKGPRDIPDVERLAVVKLEN